MYIRLSICLSVLVVAPHVMNRPLNFHVGHA